MGRMGLLLALFTLTACASNTGTGVITGVTLGASAGAIGGGGTGALIGSAAGAIVGGLVGAALDESQKKAVEKVSPRTVDRMDRGDPLSINDVIKLSQSGVSDDAILSYMQDSPGAYRLSQAQVRRLQDAGVSPRVIQYMQQKNVD
jgi:outer membrane lipoprotein SlyB